MRHFNRQRVAQSDRDWRFDRVVSDVVCHFDLDHVCPEGWLQQRVRLRIIRIVGLEPEYVDADRLERRVQKYITLPRGLGDRDPRQLCARLLSQVGADGIASWDRSQFREAMRHGIRPCRVLPHCDRLDQVFIPDVICHIQYYCVFLEISF